MKSVAPERVVALDALWLWMALAEAVLLRPQAAGNTSGKHERE